MDGAGFLRAVNASDALLPVFTSVELNHDAIAKP
jgi:hypothetical protein